MPDVEVCRADKLLFTGECPGDSGDDVKKKLIRAKLKVGLNLLIYNSVSSLQLVFRHQTGC